MDAITGYTAFYAKIVDSKCFDNIMFDKGNYANVTRYIENLQKRDAFGKNVGEWNDWV